MRTFKIDGADVVVAPGWGVSDSINARTTAQFTVYDLQNLAEINIGDEVEISDQNGIIFRGTVETVDEYEPDPGHLEYTVSAVDFNALADKRLIADSFVDTLAGDIVRAFIDNVLHEEGITAGNIADGPTILRAAFNYETAAACLDYLKDLTGLNWNIDSDKKLHFFDRSEDLSPWTLDDTVQHANFSRNRTRNQYRNRQFVRAGRGETAEQELETPTPAPDGESRNFVMRFPLAKRPRIYISRNNGPLEEVPETDIGVNGLDKNKKWYFSYESNVITQDDSEPVLDRANGDSIRVTYIGLLPILTVADNPQQIDGRREKETGTSGVYEQMTKETNIDQASAAVEFAQGLLQKYGIIPNIVSFETRVPGLKAGQLLPIKKPLYKIDGSFLIESVQISGDGPDIIYSVKALDGSSLGGWEEFFKDLIKGGRDFVIQANEVLIVLMAMFELQSWNEETDIQVNACPIPQKEESSFVTPFQSVTVGLFPDDDLFPC